MNTTTDAVAEAGATLSSTFDHLTQSLFGGLSLGKLLAAVVVLLVCLAVTRVILTAVRRVADRSKLDATLQGFLLRLLKVFLLALSVMIAASTLGIDVTSLVAVLGVASLAVSLALQGTLSNLVGGVMLLTAKPFTLGDFIESGSYSGTVQAIGLFYTTISTYDNKEIFIPNSTLSGSTIVNYTAEPKRMVEITISVPGGSDLQAVKEALAAAAEKAPGRVAEDAVFTAVNAYQDGTAQCLLRCWVESSAYFDAKFYVTEQIQQEFAARGLAMAAPRMRVVMDQP